MGTQAVLNDITEGKAERYIENRSCSVCDSNSKDREKLDQNDLDLLTESTTRLKLIGRMFWEMDSFDKVELGTVAIMLNNEARHISELVESLETRLGV